MPITQYLRMTRWLNSAGAPRVQVPAAFGEGEVVGSAGLDGKVYVTISAVPTYTEGLIVRYNVDQDAAPTEAYLGLEFCEARDVSTLPLVLSLSGVQYGASYKISVFPCSPAGIGPATSVTVTGPFNPLAYGAHLESWIDARRETAYEHTNPVTTPTQWLDGGPAFTQAGATGLKPTWREAADGIGGVPAFLFDDDATQSWLGPDTEMHHNTRGLTVAALANVDDTAIATALYLFTKWQQGGNARTWRLGKGTGDWLCYYDQDGDGSPQGFVQGGGDNTNTHSMVSTWNPGVDARLYDLGVLVDTDTAINYTQLGGASGNASLLRIGCSYGSVAQELYWSGRAAVILAYSEDLGEMAATLLSDDLAALAGA